MRGWDRETVYVQCAKVGGTEKINGLKTPRMPLFIIAIAGNANANANDAAHHDFRQRGFITERT